MKSATWIALCAVTLQSAMAAGKCDNACPEIYLPVCGSDGKTYSNKCEFEYAKCSEDPKLMIANEGECEKPKCEEGFMCTADYDPLCGSDGKTYGNDCELQREKCENPKLMPMYMGICREECEKECPEESAPVCGSNGRTYGNKCLLEKGKCRIPELTMASEGKCTGEEGTGNPDNGKCEKECKEIYTPLCASDGKTYSNMCYFNNAQCKAPKLTMVSEGECSGDGSIESSQVGSVDGSLEGSGVECDDLFCTSEFEPVCGSNEITYSNMCELTKAKCNDSTIELASEGECKDTDNQDGDDKEEDAAVSTSVPVWMIALSVVVGSVATMM